MRVTVALEHRFLRIPDGSVWTQSQCSWSFWRRYLDVFDTVQCIARVRDVARLEGELRQLTVAAHSDVEIVWGFRQLVYERQ